MKDIKWRWYWAPVGDTCFIRTHTVYSNFIVGFSNITCSFSNYLTKETLNSTFKPQCNKCN